MPSSAFEFRVDGLAAARVPADVAEWALYPPLLHFRNVPLNGSAGEWGLRVDDDVLDEYDVAHYLMEHQDVPFTVFSGRIR